MQRQSTALTLKHETIRGAAIGAAFGSVGPIVAVVIGAPFTPFAAIGYIALGTLSGVLSFRFVTNRILSQSSYPPATLTFSLQTHMYRQLVQSSGRNSDLLTDREAWVHEDRKKSFLPWQLSRVATKVIDAFDLGKPLAGTPDTLPENHIIIPPEIDAEKLLRNAIIEVGTKANCSPHLSYCSLFGHRLANAAPTLAKEIMKNVNAMPSKR